MQVYPIRFPGVTHNSLSQLPEYAVLNYSLYWFGEGGCGGFPQPIQIRNINKHQ